MAKIAQVTYGTHGDTRTYTYIVNDNVRSGDYLRLSVKHAKSGTVFDTTAIAQKLSTETSKNGQAIKQDLNKNGVELANAYTGKELGVQRQRTAQGKFESIGGGMGKTEKNAETGMFQAKGGKEFQPNKYIQQVGKLNVEKRIVQDENTPQKPNTQYVNINKGD